MHAFVAHDHSLRLIERTAPCVGWPLHCRPLWHVLIGFRGAALLLLPSLNVHADHDEPQGQHEFRAAGHQNVGQQMSREEMWVRVSSTNWMNRFPGRNRLHDACIGLLIWDLLGSVLGYIEWND